MVSDERRNDGLVDVRCPYCRGLWYRVQPAPPVSLHEIRCPGSRCKRTVLYRVDHGRVEDQAATRV